MAIDAGIGHWEIAVTGVQIGVAYTGRDDLDQHLLGLRRVELDSVDVECPGFLFHYSRSDTHFFFFLPMLAREPRLRGFGVTPLARGKTTSVGAQIVIPIGGLFW